MATDHDSLIAVVKLVKTERLCNQLFFIKIDGYTKIVVKYNGLFTKNAVFKFNEGRSTSHSV